MKENNFFPKIYQSYKNYSPHINIEKVISRLLNGVQERYLIGLNSIVIIDKESLGIHRVKQKIKVSGRKISLDKCQGFYNKKEKNQKAYIEIIVDNIIEINPKIVFRIPFFCDMIFSNVLFHEIGHHIHFTQVPIYKDREKVADEWGKTLRRKYFKKKYWYWYIVLYPVIIIKKLIKNLRNNK